MPPCPRSARARSAGASEITLAVAVAEPLEERRRALDVAEDERDGSAGKRRHAPSIAGAWQARGREPPRQRNEPVPAPAPDNPVEWYPWGDEALERARDEDKPIFLSVGYSACHWCHVMEHETFEDQRSPPDERALREHQGGSRGAARCRLDLHGRRGAMTGRGGWPMSVFLTPDCSRSTAARISRRRRGWDAGLPAGALGGGRRVAQSTRRRGALC